MGSPARWESAGDKPPVPEEITDEQREAIEKFLTENPGRGFKLALKAAGVHCTRAEAKKIVQEDPQLRDAYLKPYRLDLNRVLLNIGEIASDPENRSSFNANTWAADVWHGLVTTRQIEHKGDLSVDHSVAVSVQHDYQAIRKTLEEAGVVTGGPAPRALHAAPDPVLPPSADGEAGGGADSAPLAP